MTRRVLCLIALLAVLALPGDTAGGGSRLIDVKAFGARGDGVTDDRAAIQSAIDSAPASGATIYFPAGVYLLKSFHPSNLNAGILRMKSNLTFAGTGTGSEIRLHPGWYMGKEFNVFSNYDHADPMRFGTYRNIVFRDLLINANGAANRYSGASGPRVVIQFGNTSDATVERVVFTGINVTNVIGIGRAQGSAGFRVHGCTFIDPTSGDAANPDHSTIYSSVADTVISGNAFRNATARGKANATAAELHASRSTFSGNSIASYRQALYLASQETDLVEDITVDNNTARDMNAWFATFWGDSDSNVVRRVKITNNSAAFNPDRGGVDETAQFIGTTREGVFSEVSITGNVAATVPGIRTTKRAIGTFSSIADWTISGNRFTGWDGGGVHVIHVGRGKTAARVTISRNEFVECGNAGIYRIPVYVNLDNAVDIRVDNNTFRSSASIQYLVYVAADSSAGGYVIGNNDAVNFSPTSQDVFVGGPTRPGLPEGVRPASIRGNWTIRGVDVHVPSLAAGGTAALSVTIGRSEYAKAGAAVSLLPDARTANYEFSGAAISADNTLTMIVRNRSGNDLAAASFRMALRVVYP